MAPPHAADRGPMMSIMAAPCPDDEIDESSETKIDEAATRRTAWSRPSTSRTRPIVPRGEGLAVTDDAARNVCRVECNVARHRRLRLRRGRGGRGARRGPATRWWSSRRATTSRRQDYTSFEGPSMNQLYEFGGSVRHHDERRRAAPGRIQYGRRRLSGELVGLPQQDARVRAQGVGDQTTHGFPLFASSDYAAAMDKVFERLGVTSGCTEEGLQNKVLRKGV
ncbi:hypothetical protein OsJ_21468 [Oryza sativa Japonica Group]|uniref:Alcohol oxidase-like n=1 Tax=Oryza sativa subsp. japonica TaxID=39947 RepID=B9FTG8_ORYSJ|nr:hypothetical protein OsJ_21468 [Oryza sativa Japonica Group]BAD45264.1 alcohol oxidase-like [Oryza sativa Japonica Group]BAD46149.1 alcohol oxidase-like [Oryza sativa Japonica Group]